MEEVTIPASVTEIEELPFDKSLGYWDYTNGIEFIEIKSDPVTYYVESGSYAEEYAKENDLAFIAYENLFSANR